MELNFQKINGTNSFLDYNLLKKSIEEKLSPTCKKAEVIVLNNFPVSVSSQSTIDFIILLRIPKIIHNYYRLESNSDRINIKNQIIAVSILREFENAEIENDSSRVKLNGNILELEDQANDVKWSLTNYLSSSCGLVRNKITVHPLFWLKTNKKKIISNNLVINNELLYKDIEAVISDNYYFKYPGYSDWIDDINFEITIRNIFDQASKDSHTGYVTKKKIDRFHTKFDVASQNAYDHIGTMLVEVKGKAGTGKSSDLLKWMLNRSLEKKSGVFLTYNHLLVNDISKQIKSFYNELPEEKKIEKRPTTTNTLHSFFYNVAKRLGVLMLLSEKRIKELADLLDKRWLIIESFFNSKRNSESGISLAKLKMLVQTTSDLDEGTKREAIDFLRFIKDQKFLRDELKTKIFFKEYRDNKIDKLSKLESSNVFLKDYTNVLKRILQATTDLDKFIKDLNIQDKYDLLFNVMRLDDKILEKDGRMGFEALKTRYRSSLSRFKHGRTLFVDEAQDCHPYERDILFSLFGSKNIVIANGDKEQLIRYSELCNWKLSQSREIDVYTYTKKKKSFRMKPAVAALANHIANYYGIDLEIEPLETEDHGFIVIDQETTLDREIKMINELHRKGERQGCTSYDSLLLMNTAENGSLPAFDSEDKSSVSVNEFGNIIKLKSQLREEWELIAKASSKTDFNFWNATGNVEKKKMSVPGSLSVRSIYYQSCRGIEAWSVMCFRLNEFFEQKYNEDEADNYLLNDLFDQLNPETRKKKYAATWVLMAITRAMENCYINFTNKDSSFKDCITEFEEKYPQFISNSKSYVCN